MKIPYFLSVKFKLTVNDPYIFQSKKDGQRVYDLPGALEDRSTSGYQTGAILTESTTHGYTPMYKI